jgi:hypothetical protein
MVKKTTEKITARDVALGVLKSTGCPMTAAQIYAESKAMKMEWISEAEYPAAVINSLMVRDVRTKGAASDFIKVSSEPNTWALNTDKRRAEAPSKEAVIPITDAPTAKKVINIVQRINIKKLGIENEHELELVMWGAMCGRWPDWIKWRKSFGGRTCDVGLSDVAVEMKYIKSMADKDRLVGQVLDYLKDVDEVVVVAIDEKGLLKESPLKDFDNVFMVVM